MKKMKKSVCTLALLEAINKGYESDDDGNIFYKGRKHNLSTNIKTGYSYFSRRIIINGKSVSRQVFVHRFVAYLKYGDEIFKKGIHVRHFNGNKKDNSKSNILLGTASQNNMDKHPDVRLKMAIRASSFVKKYDHEEIVKMHKEGLSYSEIMRKTGINNKGTVSFIVKQSIESKK